MPMSDNNVVELQPLLSVDVIKSEAIAEHSTKYVTTRKDGSKLIWIQGLRGFVASRIIVHHICRATILSCDFGALTPSGDTHIFQFPPFRFLYTGEYGVPMFAIILGFVCGQKAILLSRQGNPEKALTHLSRSAFRRIWRMFLPTVAITTIAWLLCQFGAYEASRLHAPKSTFMRHSAERSESVYQAILDLLQSIAQTWTPVFSNKYSRTLWMIRDFLFQSMHAYLILFMMAHVRGNIRFVFLAILYFYAFSIHSVVGGANMIAGLIFAEMECIGIPERVSKIKGSGLRVMVKIMQVSSFLLGILFCCYPCAHVGWANWSAQMRAVGTIIFPTYGGMSIISRFYFATGAQLLFFSIMFSNRIQSVLSTRLLTAIGDISWATYLLHGIILKTLAPHFMLTKTIDGPWALPSTQRLILTGPLFFMLSLLVAKLWMMYIEPCFERLSLWIEKYVYT